MEGIGTIGLWQGITARLAIWRQVIWGPALLAVGVMWGLLNAWDVTQSQLLPGSWQNDVPRVFDVIADQPWYLWSLVALALLVAFTLEGAYRLVPSSSALAVTWPSQGISIPLHGQGDINHKTSATSTTPVELIYKGQKGQETIDIRKVILLARISYGRITSWNAIRQASDGEKMGLGALGAAISGQPMDLRWSPEDADHVRELEGLPVTVRANDPLRLPQLWLQVEDQDRAIELFEQCESLATWEWTLTIHTEKGRDVKDVATPIRMQPVVEKE